MRKVSSLAGIILVITLFATQLALAASGMPDSPEFGYGACLDLNSEHVQAAIQTATVMGLDWIRIDFDWATQWPDGNVSPDLEALNQVMSIAKQNQLNVLLSITHAPTWGSSPTGPDPDITANLVVSLARLYPDTLLAVELFPGANTLEGWGASPDPVAYTALLKTVHAALQADGRSVTPVAGGLTPLPSNSPAGNMDDLVFLESLYNAGAQPAMPIIGMRLPEVTGDPMSAPADNEHRVLRHYEEIRQIMLQHDHRSGLVWITGFAWPTSTADSNAQALWISEAYKLLSAQLYMGAAFFNQLNPPNTAISAVPSLLDSELRPRPAFISISQLIDPSGHPEQKLGQAVLVKKISDKVDFKHLQP